MRKREKIILIICVILGISIMGVMISVGNKNKIEQKRMEIEELVNDEEYGKVIDLFYEIEKMEKDFGLTQNECFAVIDYVEALQAYKNKNYEITYEKLKALNIENTWIFKKDAEKFKREFLNSEKAKAIASRLMEEEKRNEELNKFREETNIEYKSDEDIVDEYTNEYDVYEYSDADEFYYDHQDDFEGYEDAEQYYEDAWSFME